MRDARRQDPRKGFDSQEMRRRLGLYARYARLIEDQVLAVDSEDMDRFQELAEAREEIQEALAQDDGALPSAETLDSKDRRLLESVRQDLRTALARDQELRKRLMGLREEARTQLHAMSRREGGVRRYVADDGPAPGDEAGRINVRL
jgi:hypothetical protein